MHRWVPVDDRWWRSVLQEKNPRRCRHCGRVGSNPGLRGQCNCTQEMTEALAEVGIQIVQYHRDVTAEDRAAPLNRMSTGEGVVMVCTDAAAREIDIPDITHVVQTDFAASAVDFLHRMGRTARAGRERRVTSLYSP